MKKSSYQVLKEKNQNLKNELRQAEKFEMQMKNLINAINQNQTEQVENLKRWFDKNTTRYAHKTADGHLY